MDMMKERLAIGKIETTEEEEEEAEEEKEEGDNDDKKDVEWLFSSIR